MSRPVQLLTRAMKAFLQTQGVLDRDVESIERFHDRVVVRLKNSPRVIEGEWVDVTPPPHPEPPEPPLINF